VHLEQASIPGEILLKYFIKKRNNCKKEIKKEKTDVLALNQTAPYEAI